MIPEQLQCEAQQLQTDGNKITLGQENGVITLVLHEYQLPPGYNKKTTDLLLRIPESYPNGQPDMFWVDEDLTLSNGAVPKKGEVFEAHVGKKWRRISWHPAKWNPGADNIYTFLSFVRAGLIKATR